ncbi:MAG TPA: hypothetical protein VKA64_02870, partial [Gammaproteobacteria bacterium]|nr:hypothetical protein [Gammaproteobacteria bacterium]
EWTAMTPEQRTRAYEKQAELDRAAQARRAQEAEARREAERRRREAIEERRRNAGYGDILQCVLKKARVRFWDDWERIEPVAFSVVRGQVMPVALREEGDGVRRSGKAWVGFDRNGQVLAVCRNKFEPDELRGCARVVGTFEMFRQGVQERIEARDFLKGTLRCDFAPTEDMPPRIILE